MHILYHVHDCIPLCMYCMLNYHVQVRYYVCVMLALLDSSVLRSTQHFISPQTVKFSTQVRYYTMDIKLTPGRIALQEIITHELLYTAVLESLKFAHLRYHPL